ncbi:ABC transporter substrate-binding protein [Rhizosaccharibacter radicis]|uniref:ABC transporter substrate-binding protein n=1 Tax=Rhizosaccharibacter radicis TaxID=2782605 RepID=A0ABT1VZ67_9PROT|nr:ABC transporter substrate-binding protein [Acetobacteraceae bacterium KSS12]
MTLETEDEAARPRVGTAPCRRRLGATLVWSRRLALAAAVSLPVAVPAAFAQGTQATGDLVVQNQSSQSCTNASPAKGSLSGMLVGFSQSENEQNPFRAAETASVKAAAKKAGVSRLLYTNANDSQAKQVADIQSMIAQGAKAIIVAPLNATGLQPALEQAAAKNIPVVTIDRATAGQPCRDFITFLGSDFATQGKRAADAMAEATGGNAKILEIQGAYGNSVETERTDGFADGLKSHPGLTLVAAQTGNWSATDAQKVMEQLLLAHPDANALYSHADVMTLGAMRAIQQAGKKPGQDIKIVSIDGTKALVKAISKGEAQADIETNPRFGPQAFSALSDWFAGKPVAQKIIMKDALFDKNNAAEAIKSNATY